MNTIILKRIHLSRSATLDIIITLFMVLFLYASIYKLFDYQVFKVQIGRSPLIMYYANTLAWLVPAIEIIAAILVFVPKFRLSGLFLSFGIMFAFSIYIFFMLTFSPYVPCSCGGILNSMGWTEHLIFNIAFTLIALAGIVLQIQESKNKREVAIT
jgi:uncharacterized membrane protein YphA (DoxX/SURF4 family)